MQHASPPQQIRWHPLPGGAEMDAVIAARILQAAALAVRERGRFLIVLAGGNTPLGAYEQLRTAPADWARWHVYFGDERCVARADDARNSRMAALAWLDHVPISRDQRHEIAGELGPAEAARLYNLTLAEVGEFDLVLLGLGDDGHTGSLFPGHPLGAQPSSPDVLAVFDAPKPPPQRVTLSAARFSRARQTFFLVAGEEKRDAVARW
ncbi:MAG: 6-phosphogluconolactonase, partial [Pseudomonadota bacterium]|nr:6-phosphogluconolactonase [Pseudomonadota bacterium]